MKTLLPTTKNSDGIVLVKVGDQLINSGTTDRTKARAVVQMAMQIAPLIKTDVGPRVQESMDDWQAWIRGWCAPRTQACQISIVTRWIREMKLADFRISALKSNHVDDWINGEDMGKAGNRRVTLSGIRSYFRWSASRGYIQGDPSKLVKVRLDRLSHDQRETRCRQVYSGAEIEQLLGHCDAGIRRLGRCMGTYGREDVVNQIERFEFWKAAIVIGLHTGLRLGDICCLEWASVGPETLTVWTDKRDRRVVLPINKPLWEVFRVMKRTDGKVFPGYCERFQKSSPNVSGSFGRLLAAVGIQGKNFHDLRSTYASTAAAAGVPTPHISAALGHKGTAITQTVYVK